MTGPCQAASSSPCVPLHTSSIKHNPTHQYWTTNHTGASTTLAQLRNTPAPPHTLSTLPHEPCCAHPANNNTPSALTQPIYISKVPRRKSHPPVSTTPAHALPDSPATLRQVNSRYIKPQIPAAFPTAHAPGQLAEVHGTQHMEDSG